MKFNKSLLLGLVLAAVGVALTVLVISAEIGVPLVLVGVAMIAAGVGA